MVDAIDFTEVYIKCIHCGIVQGIRVPTTGLEAWKKGQYIQDALPMTSASDRELMISHICHACWEELFPEEELVT